MYFLNSTFQQLFFLHYPPSSYPISPLSQIQSPFVYLKKGASLQQITTKNN